MAIITEEPDLPTSPPHPPEKPTSPPLSTRQPTTAQTASGFSFWFYLTLSASVITLFFVSLSSLSQQDPKSWFLSLPTALRQHYSKGRIIKVQIIPDQPQIEVFSVQEGPVSWENVFILHGLGCSSYAFREIVKILGAKGVHAVAIDLPGSGFSDKSRVVVEESSGGVLERFWELYAEIKEKGLFWGFDQLIENGYVNYEEKEMRVFRREKVGAIKLGAEEMGRVLGQVIDSMGLAPVDLVLHDSALGLAANWVLENSGLVRSVIILDAASNATALPLWVLEFPVIREVALGLNFVFAKVLGWCCLKSAVGSEVEAHRTLLNGRDGRRAVVGMGQKLNHSFDLAEWGALDGVKDLPMQVIWSGSWSEKWSEEGRQVAGALPRASFAAHTGGRWPQDHTANEIAENIYRFVSSLPKPTRETEEGPIPEHIQKMFDEAKSSNHHHQHVHGGHAHHDHDHLHAAGYMDAYGLGHGWAS